VLTPEFDWASETARRVGTVVHRELQRCARARVLPDEAALMGRRRLFTVELAELGVPPSMQESALERVMTALRHTIADPRGRWLFDASHRGATAELAVTGRTAADTVSVAVDRTFLDTSGVRWIVDYKTSMHEGGGLDAFLDREQQRYRPQLDRYAELLRELGPEPIRLGLYFPLFSAWREWSAE
jgi:ATP-dependent exoDNAse (exonuclease V) beta subunit